MNRSAKRVERSDGLDTTLYKNIPLPFLTTYFVMISVHKGVRYYNFVNNSIKNKIG